MIRSRTVLSLTRMVAAVALGFCLWTAGAYAQQPPMTDPMPKVGEKARNFTLQSLDGTSVSLSDEISRGPLVLVVLRGWPGYQCPFCTRQFGDFLANATMFDKAGARVLFVYPGPSQDLKTHAQAFAAGKTIPGGFVMLLDPDYTFTNAYGLRWNAPNETAYPSTFVLDRNGVVTFAHTSREHGGRVTAETVLKALGGQ